MPSCLCYLDLMGISLTSLSDVDEIIHSINGTVDKLFFDVVNKNKARELEKQLDKSMFAKSHQRRALDLKGRLTQAIADARSKLRLGQLPPDTVLNFDTGMAASGRVLQVPGQNPRSPTDPREASTAYMVLDMLYLREVVLLFTNTDAQFKAYHLDHDMENDLVKHLPAESCMGRAMRPHFTISQYLIVREYADVDYGDEKRMRGEGRC